MLGREEFERRYRNHFYDPAFDAAQAETGRVTELGWNLYSKYRKAPRTRKAGRQFADPDYELSVEWLAARDAVRRAAQQHADRSLPRRVLLVIGSPRNDKTCPGEVSKTWRLAQLARQVFRAKQCACDVLDLSLLTSEYGRVIYPCKACVSTAMPLCHWPCSCYPNHALGQVNDWMNDIYPLWVAAHGVMVVTPVHWLGVPAALKLMMDRLVCADGGNPDPTRTQGKTPELAKRIELAGWDYPRHLAGRMFSVIVHGDTEGAELVRRALVDWLSAMALVPAGGMALLDRQIGYYQPYAASHDALDRDRDVQEEVRNAARTLVHAMQQRRDGRREADAGLRAPREK